MFLRVQKNKGSLVNKYRASLKQNNNLYLLIFNLLIAISQLIQLTLYVVTKDGLEVSFGTNDSSTYYVIIGLRGSILVAIFALLIISSISYLNFGKYIYIALYLWYLYAHLAVMYFIDAFEKRYVSHIMTIELALAFICCIQCGVLDLVESICSFIILIISYIGLYIFLGAINDSIYSNIDFYQYVGFFVGIAFYSFLNTYHYLKTEIQGFNNKSLGVKKINQMVDFIDRLLPRHVRKSLQEQQENEGEKHKNVTLLYADIVGFTAYSSEHTPPEVVELISHLFTSFDKVCNSLNLYKVYTIGDCYVVMSFLDKNDRKKPEEEARDVLEFGFRMLEIIAQVRKEVNFDLLKMRIGIHTGEIIGGVVGTGIIRFDLYGQDVLIANKMESEGIPDKVKVSKATRDLLLKIPGLKVRFIKQDDVDVKRLNKSVENYIVEKDDF